MSLLGRIAKSTNRGGNHDWLSRDTKDLDCHAVGCVYNHQSKCMVPSLCKINSMGACDGFKPRPLPPRSGE